MRHNTGVQGHREEAIEMASRMTDRKITRRTVLFSLGVLAAVPLLDACTPGVDLLGRNALVTY